MPFTLLPAIDVAGGRAVRGAVGDARPLRLALDWRTAGATWVHLADLDAAYGRGSNSALLASVVGGLDGVETQLSGGIVDDVSLDRACSTGCSRVVLATASLRDLDWVTTTIAEHGDRVAVGLDVRVDGVPTPGGGHRLVDRGDGIDRGDLWATIEHLDAAGCARYVVTDVDRDGALGGVAVDLCRAVVARTATPVIASGGVSSLRDLTDLAAIGGLDGVIIGSALHAGRFTLGEAIDAVARVAGSSDASRRET